MWQLLDLYSYPDDLEASALLSTAIGKTASYMDEPCVLMSFLCFFSRPLSIAQHRLVVRVLQDLVCLRCGLCASRLLQYVLDDALWAASPHKPSPLLQLS